MNTNNENKTPGKLENLEYQIEKLTIASKDRYFTEYLQKLMERVREQKYQADLLQDELERCYRMYVNRMQMIGIQVPEEMEAALQPQSLQPCSQEQEIIPTPSESAMNVNTQETLPLKEQTELLIQPEPAVQCGNQELLQSQEQTAQSIRPEAGVRYVSWNELTSQPGHDYQAVPKPAPAKKNNAEFIIGATILGIVGGAFILAALVMLGMNYMNGFARGMCQYGVFLILFLVSELLIYKRFPKLGCTLSAISIGGLYLSTVLNYLSLHNFNLWVTLSIILVITLAVILLSRKRDSVLYRIIGLTAGYLCFFMIREGITDTEFLVVSGMILLLNLLFIAVPARRYQTALNVTHMAANMVFAQCFVARAFVCEVPITMLLVFEISSTAVLQVLLLVELIYHQKEVLLAEQNGNRVGENAGILTTYCISTVIYAGIIVSLIYELLNSVYAAGDLIWYYGSAAGIGGIALIVFLILCIRKCPQKWYVYYYINFMMFCIVSCSIKEWDGVICLLVMLVISKVLSLKRIPALKISDAAITSVMCIALALYDEPQVYALLAGVFISIFFISQWQTYHEIILTSALALYTASKLPAMLQLPAVVGILFVGILVFNNVRKWKDNYILVYNALALSGQVICFWLLANPVYRNAYITYLCMMVFGLATIEVTFQEKYRMNFRWKHWILAIFLTYMAFIFRTNIPVINSILLMVIALVCVGIGFAERKKAMRIYGLVLSLLVCGKIVLYDFLEAPSLQKTILFFAVGVIALIIAGIYIILEKKSNVSAHLEANYDKKW